MPSARTRAARRRRDRPVADPGRHRAFAAALAEVLVVLERVNHFEDRRSILTVAAGRFAIDPTKLSPVFP